MSNSISTLYELNQSLSDLFLKSDFEELNLGPLLKQPVVYDMFKAPQGFPPGTSRNNYSDFEALGELHGRGRSVAQES